MNELTRRYLNDLSAAFESDARIQALQQAEETLASDPELLALVQEKEKAEASYLEARFDYGEEDPKTQEAQRLLHLAKKALDEHPRAATYTARFAEVSAIYRELDDILFGSFREVTPCRRKR